MTVFFDRAIKGAAAAVSLTVTLTSCVGAVDAPSGSKGDGTGVGASSGSGGTSSTSGGDGWPTFAASRAFQLRRLTNEQFTASVETLLGVSTEGMPAIEPVSPVAGFPAIGASTAAVSGAGVGQFEEAARFLSQAAFATDASRQKFMPCTPSGIDDSACFASFVTSFGERAFRRPLTAAEAASY
ncbi:MAG TPA: DUF1587 domain-containing protein, partial [Polyangiaceae bacterium]|nr:DUF1587 domain-containing protein [Polyangiaceae bacterium]